MFTEDRPDGPKKSFFSADSKPASAVLEDRRNSKERKPRVEVLQDEPEPEQDYREQPRREQSAAQGFAQTYGFHPAIAALTVAVDLMLNLGTGFTLGALWPVTVLIGFVLGIITYLAQKKWYGDDKENAFIKALIVALLTAIPAPLSPVLIPSGLAGLFRKKR